MKVQTTNFNIVLCSVQKDFVLQLYIATKTIRLIEQIFLAVYVTQALATSELMVNLTHSPLVLLIFTNIYRFLILCKLFFVLDI